MIDGPEIVLQLGIHDPLRARFDLSPQLAAARLWPIGPIGAQSRLSSKSGSKVTWMAIFRENRWEEDTSAVRRANKSGASSADETSEMTSLSCKPHGAGGARRVRQYRIDCRVEARRSCFQHSALLEGRPGEIGPCVK